MEPQGARTTVTHSVYDCVTAVVAGWVGIWAARRLLAWGTARLANYLISIEQPHTTPPCPTCARLTATSGVTYHPL